MSDVDREALLRAVVSGDGGLNVSVTVHRQLAGQRSFIPAQAIVEAIRSGARAADPQGVPGHTMYTIGASYGRSRGALEVLVEEASGQIRHVLYRRG